MKQIVGLRSARAKIPAVYVYEDLGREAAISSTRYVPDRGRDLLDSFGSARVFRVVYIDGLQGRAPEAAADILDLRQVNHSTVAIQELMHTTPSGFCTGS
ncbi:hypothetical protein [Mesorhizobium amorphae]|uniref:hypothetical protein n=1 Tax=Mesorhizobium amorphae TaxID=71433 RepID=UPI0002EBB6CA